MSLNIKNEKVEELARAVSKESGETITQSILHALEERAQRLRGRRKAPDLFETIMDISARCSNLADLDKRVPDEVLGYDEAGTFY